MSTQREPLVRLPGSLWEIDPATGCWNWLGARDQHGYGHCAYGRAHRVVFVQYGNGLAPDDHLHHRCENKSCVNPDHLEPLTPTAHKTLHAQEDSTLSWEDVRAIRARAHAGETLNALAEEYGLSLGTMSPLLAGRTWVDPDYQPPAFQRVCPQCGESFTARRTNQRFCSIKHKNRWNGVRTNRRKAGTDLDAPVRQWTRRAA